MDRETLPAFLRAFAASAAKWPLAPVLVLGGALLEGVGLALLLPLLHLLSSGADGPMQAMPGLSQDPAVIALLAAFLLVMVVRGLVLHRRDLLLWEVESDFVDGQRSRVMRHVTRAGWGPLASLSHTRITSLISTEMQRLATATRLLVQIGVGGLLLLVQAVLVVAVAPQAAGAVALLALAGIGAVLVAGRRSQSLGRELGARNHELIQGVSNLLAGLKAALAENLQGRFVAEFEAAQSRLRGHRGAFVARQARDRLLFNLGTAVAVCALTAGGLWVLEIDTPTLILMVLVLARMAGPVAGLLQSLPQFLHALPAFSEIETLESELRSIDEGGSDLRPLPQGPIEIRDGAFRRSGRVALEGLNLTLAPGERVALTGPSGVGKTTLLDLLAGLLPLDAGSICVGGEIICASRLAAWRGSIAYVTQSPFLLDDTVRANLAPGVAHAEDELWTALDRVGASAFVRGIEEGLDSRVGERGALMSGGERQRLAIARALLRRPRLLMLDEATNAIDLASEAALLQMLEELDPRPTVLWVTHRRENLSAFDRVLDISCGELLSVN